MRCAGRSVGCSGRHDKLHLSVRQKETRRAFGPFHAYLTGMKAFLVIVVIAVCGYLWFRHTHSPAAVAARAAAPVPTRPPVSERAVSAADPAVPLYRAKQVADKV